MTKAEKKRRERTERRIWLAGLLLAAFELGYMVGRGPDTEKS